MTHPSRLAASVLAVVALTGAAPKADDLAAQIDKRLEARWKAEAITPAPAADDSEFLRRLALDIGGRIPSPSEVHAFLADRSADKRRKLIDRLLASPRYAVHFANVWRAELTPEMATGGGAALFQRGFEAWLQQRLRQGVGHDKVVRELLTVPLPAVGQEGAPTLRDPSRPNPLAFLAVKEAKPENLAAAVSRSLLGVRLECAQCHDHPFAKWKQEQFWQLAAFFAGIKKDRGGLFGTLNEATDRREITPE